MSEFLHDDDDDAKAIAIPWVFSKNSRAKNGKKLCEKERMLVTSIFFFQNIIYLIKDTL